MKNMLGEDVEPRKITLKWSNPHLYIYINEHWHGMVSPNGWQGHSMDIDHKLGEPVMTNLQIWSTLSFSEMISIMKEYEKNMEPARAMQIVIGRIAENKKLSFNDAFAYVKKQKIPLYH